MTAQSGRNFICPLRVLKKHDSEFAEILHRTGLRNLSDWLSGDFLQRMKRVMPHGCRWKKSKRSECVDGMDRDCL
jgi:hypothetical protein